MYSFSNFANKTVVVTGHTGFKGSWLVLWLQKLGANVHGISLNIPTTPSHYECLDLSKSISDHFLDVRDLMGITELISKINPDYLFHMAAQPLVPLSYENPVETWTTNAIGTVNVLEALRFVSKPCVAVFITSDKAYDNVEWVWGYRETDRLGGPDPYSSSKAAADISITSYVKSFFTNNSLVRIGIARAGNVIGGGDFANSRIFPDCFNSWSRGEPVILRHPSSTRPWQHVLEPLCGYMNLALTLTVNETLHGQAFNFGPNSDQIHSVLTLVQEIRRHWSDFSFSDVSDPRNSPYESTLLKLNCDKALHHLKWSTVWNFQETIAYTCSWYNSFANLADKMSIKSISNSQIDEFTSAALSKSYVWAS